MTTITSRGNCLELNIHPSSVSVTRYYVRRTLVAWRQDNLIEIAELVASELVTNAIKATADIFDRTITEARKSPQYVAIGMYRNGGYVVMEVWDAERTPPRRIEPHDDGGRGLMLVEALTQGWGYRWPLTGGKIVWCIL